MQSKKYDFIDFLRGIAILLVFINHIPRNEDILFSNLNFLQSYFFKFGTFGVQLFYIVSAFTLLVSLNSYKEKNYINFFIRRIFRVVPIFFLGIYFYSFHISFGSTDLKNVILNLLFLNNLIPPSNDLIPGGATISTEMNFYLLLPLMFIFINSYKKTIYSIFITSVILLLVNLFFEQIYIDKEFGDANFYRTIFTQIFVFLLGFVAFYINNKYLGENLNQFKIKKIIKKSIPIIILALLILVIGRREIEYFYFRNLMLVSIFLFLLFNFVYIYSSYFLNNFIFIIVKNIGKVSFSMYVWHWFIVSKVWDYLFLPTSFFKGKMLLFIIISLLITYLFSLVSYQIEKFFINLGKKFTTQKN